MSVLTGAGKGTLRKALQKERTDLDRSMPGTLVVQLGELPRGKREDKWIGRTNRGLPEVTSLLDPQLATCLDWLSRLYDTPHTCVYEPRGVVRKWLDQQATKTNGLMVIIDDTDEIGEQSLNRLIELIRNDVSLCVNPQYGRDVRLCFVLLGRAEILRFGASEIRKLYDLSQGAGKGLFRLSSAEIVALADEDRLRARIEGAVNWRLIGNDGFGDSDRKRVRVYLDSMFTNGRPPEYLRQALAYLDSANETVAILAKALRKNSSIDKDSFLQEFFLAWWARAERTHHLPPITRESSSKYRQHLSDAMEYVQGKKRQGEPCYLDENTRDLLLSGFVVLVPPSTFGGAIEVRLQFPFIPSSVARAPR